MEDNTTTNISRQEPELYMIMDNPVQFLKLVKDNWSPKYTKYLFMFFGLILVIAILLCVGSVLIWYLSVSGLLLDFLTWVSSIGYWGNLVMILVIIFVNFPFMVGYGSLMMASGFLFGLFEGLLTVIIGCQIGIVLVLCVIRIPYFKERSWRYINSQPYVKALMEELTLHQVKFSVLVRITPLPVGLQNLMLALSPIPLWQYVIASFLGMIIEQIPIVYIGTTARELAAIVAGDVEIGWVEIAVMIMSGLGVCIFTAGLFFLARKALKKVKERELELIEQAKNQQTPSENPVRDEDAPVEIELEEYSKADSQQQLTNQNSLEVEIPVEKFPFEQIELFEKRTGNSHDDLPAGVEIASLNQVGLYDEVDQEIEMIPFNPHSPQLQRRIPTKIESEEVEVLSDSEIDDQTIVSLEPEQIGQEIDLQKHSSEDFTPNNSEQEIELNQCSESRSDTESEKEFTNPKQEPNETQTTINAGPESDDFDDIDLS